MGTIPQNHVLAMDELTINQEYAERFEKKKKAEELSLLREKYGDDYEESSSSSSSSEEEDDHGTEVTARKTKAFLQTLSLVKQQDPSIYDPDTLFYASAGSSGSVESDDDDDDDNASRKDPSEPMYLKDYERKRLLERGEKAFLSDSEDDEDDKLKTLTYSDEQEELRTDFKMAVDDGTQRSDEPFLMVREKDESQLQREEEDYIDWLKGQEKEMNKDEAKKMSALRQYWVDPKLDNDEAFLRDYILNKGWLDYSAGNPTYEDIVSYQPDTSEDEAAIEDQDTFEHKYNFRFEEPGGTEIVSYPRKITMSVRRQDDLRKEKRRATEQRKAREKEQKREELQRLKNLKKQEILEKLEKLKRITGNSDIGFSTKDFEGDFDASQYDAAMGKVFSQEYYQDENGAEEEKPLFTDSEGENWDEWERQEHKEEGVWHEGEVQDAPHCDDPDFNMDADYQPPPSGDESKKLSKRRKRMSKFSHVIHQKRPQFNPEDKHFDDYYDEFYKLDYEDIIGDLPCRFRYRDVVPNDFGLSVEEVLTCEDKELNKWVSLKKAVQYRTKDEEKSDLKKYRRKARDLAKKERVLVSLRRSEKEECGDIPPANDGGDDGDDGAGGAGDDGDGAGGEVKGSRKRKRKLLLKKKKAAKEGKLTSTRLSAYGLGNSKTKKRK